MLVGDRGVQGARASGLSLDAGRAGVITAVGGGVIRDILVNRVPAIFGGSPLCATVAVVGNVEMVLLLGRATRRGMALSIVTCAALGLVARAAAGCCRAPARSRCRARGGVRAAIQGHGVREDAATGAW